MRIHYLDQESAQSAADQAHQYLIDNDVSYAASVEAGRTTCWHLPAEDEQGWYVTIDQRLYELFGVQPEEAVE